MTASFPAPWSLRGYGYVFVYRFSSEFLARNDVVPAGIRPSFEGGVGALMLVDYVESDCGPYRELLLIPGRFRIQGVLRHSITRIFVSSEVSVVNGRANWGIPKERAEFGVTRPTGNSEAWRVTRDGSDLFAATLRTKRWGPRFPVHTALLPSHIVQRWQGQTFVTPVSAHGLARPCAMYVAPGPGGAFPDLSDERPVLGTGVRVDPFSMRFGVPEVSGAEES